MCFDVEVVKDDYMPAVHYSVLKATVVLCEQMSIECSEIDKEVHSDYLCIMISPMCKRLSFARHDEDVP